MTNHWCDIGNSDCIMIIGSNAAENHPISFKWVMRAMEKGAKLISVDPRFTRSSSQADIYAPLRSGTDIAFMGGIINHAIQNDLINKEYVVNYTNASFLINPRFKFRKGKFSGFDTTKNVYADKSTWQYQLDENGVPKKDKTLKDKNCVYQLMKKHYNRYTIDKVCQITGTPKGVYKEIMDCYLNTRANDKSGTIMYAMGTTQHTHGTQNIRTYAILQLLMGNMGVAGGGINALRGESNVQGSTDMCLLFHIIPGYLKCPDKKDQKIDQYATRYYEGKNKDPKSADWWSNGRKYLVSLLKAFYGDRAIKTNDFCFDHLPKRSANYSHMSLFEEMYKGGIKGLFCWGQNPAVGGPNAKLERKALENLDWLVASDLWETETAAFWKRPGVSPETIQTEVFLLPAAASMEKEGSITNSGRWMQWRYQGPNPPGDAKTDLWMIDQIMTRVRELYAKDGGKFAKGVLDLAWSYSKEGDEPCPHQVAREINGYDLSTGKLLPSFGKLKADGTTSSGNWLYCASYTEKGNMSARRSKKDAVNNIGLYPEWSWCWPVNRRIIYNRASVDLNGQPLAPHKYVIKWDTATGKWIGDVPDGGWPPMAVNPDKTRYPFIMKPEGHARLFGMGRADGPLPEHYEPMESPVKNTMPNSCQNTPAVHIYKSDMNEFGTPDKYPIVATSYRVTEHWQAGAMTRNLPYLVELMPEMFVEISEELAAQKGIKSMDMLTITTARGAIDVKAMVTKRLKPFQCNGKVVHEVGLPWHWGYTGLGQGQSANLLTPHVGDVNTRIPEFKAFLCDVKKKGGAA